MTDTLRMPSRTARSWSARAQQIGSTIRGRAAFWLVTAAGLLVLLSSACATRPAQPTAPPARQVPATAVQAEQVRRGDISQTLAYSGEIRSKGQFNVLPKASGRVQKMLVDIGSRVKAGDTLAELDTDSAAIQVLQARAGLASADAKLATVQAGGKADDVAAAQAGLSQQQIRLRNLRSGGRAEDVALAQAALDAVQARLDLMESGGREEQVTSAQAGVDSAKAALALLKKGATNDQRVAAQAAVEQAKAALASAEAALANFGGTSQADLQAQAVQMESARGQSAVAEMTARSADAAYASAVAARDAAQLALTQLKAPTEQQVAAVKTAQQQAFAQRAAAKATVSALANSAPGTACAPGSNGDACQTARNSADQNLEYTELALAAATLSYDIVINGGNVLDQATRKSQLAQAEASVRSADAGRTQAQTALTTARENLKAQQLRYDAIKNGSLDAQKAQLQSTLVTARENLRSAQARLDQIVTGPQPEEIQRAEYAVTQAEQQLALAQSPSTEQDLTAQRAAVEQARLNLQKARSPYTTFDIQQQEQAVAQAEANVRRAQNPYSEQDVQAAQAGVEQSRATLEQALLGIREASVTAPVDGIVSDRLAAPGALVSPSSPLFVIVPPSLELVVNVEEAQLGKVREGQTVSLEVPAYPGQTFVGAVAAIAPVLDSKSRTASVRVEPKDSEGKLKAGMFARLAITTTTRPNALVVPKEAVLGLTSAASAPSPSASNAPQTLVVVVEDGNRVRRMPVRVGLVNERFAEIVSGLADGQLVATSGQGDLADGDVVAPQVEQKTALTDRATTGL